MPIFFSEYLYYYLIHPVWPGCPIEHPFCPNSYIFLGNGNSLNFRRADSAKSLECSTRVEKTDASRAEKDNRRGPRFMGRGEEI